MPSLDCTYDRATGRATFEGCDRTYVVTPPLPAPRGKPRIKLFDGDTLLGGDRFDPWSARERAAFVRRLDLNGQAETVARELVVLAETLDQEAEEARRAGRKAGDDEAGVDEEIPYRSTPAGLVYDRPTQNGTIPALLTNFGARIVEEVVADDGEETHRAFGIEATLHGVSHRIELPASQFAGMAWPTRELGAEWVVSAGISSRDHARAAIQLLSGRIPKRRVYTHTGWRVDPEHGPVYLHAGGAIGADGPVAGVAVKLEHALANYLLPAPPTGEAAKAAVRASLRTLEVAPPALTFPLYCAIWRGALGGPDFALHVTGQTHEGKTELAATAQQHYGAAMDGRNLPANWSSTANFNEALAFAAKDALFVLDDFVPTGTHHDREKLHAAADRYFRNQGNGAGRGRLNSDLGQRRTKRSRAMTVSTGEDVPKGHSLRGRLLILNLAVGALRWDLLNACQRDAREGRYAEALAGFVAWLAPKYEDTKGGLRAAIEGHRARAAANAAHRRTPEIVANLAVGFDLFLAYAREIGAVDADEAADLERRCWAALGAAAAAQAQYQGANEPTAQFMAVLDSALASGLAHVAGPDGKAPANPAAWGWRLVTVGAGLNEREEWQAQGARVGWVADDDLYWESEASIAVAKDLARRGGDDINVSSQTLRRRLSERGLLASREGSRETVAIRKVLDGTQRSVLHMKVSTFRPEEPEPDDADAADAGAGDGADVRFGRPDSRADDTTTQSTFAPGEEERKQWTG